MSKTRRYPKLFIRSKNELAKHISHKGFSVKEASDLITDVRANFEQYWKDSQKSEPEKEKYVRSAQHTPLGRLLKKIDSLVLVPHDHLVPEFIFGGLKGRNHAKAAKSLIGSKKRRTLLKIDLKRFFEQNESDQVFSFFRDRCGCSTGAATLLTDICCVPVGPKGNGSRRRTIARGFPTSPRLAVWCNLDTFIKLDRLVRKRLKGKNPRIAIYVDDIGITASRVSKKEIESLRDGVISFLSTRGVIANEEKTKIISHEEGIEYVGIRINRNSLSTGKKSTSKRIELKKKMKERLTKSELEKYKRSRKGMMNYKKYIETLADSK